MDLGFGPDERLSGFVVGFDEAVAVRPKPQGGAVQRLGFQDREPDFDLVEPGSARRREVEVHVRMTLEPAVILWFVGVEVVEDDVMAVSA